MMQRSCTTGLDESAFMHMGCSLYDVVQFLGINFFSFMPFIKFNLVVVIFQLIPHK